MEDPPGTIARPRERLLVSAAGLALAILMTWPLATGLGSLGRTRATDADGQFSIWNIAWVARTAGRRSAPPLRRQHLFSAQDHAGVFGGEHPAGTSLGLPVVLADEKSVADAERRAALRLHLVVRVRVAALRPADRRPARGRRRGRPLRVLPVRDLAPLAHPAALHRRHPAVDADAPPGRGQTVASPRRRRSGWRWRRRRCRAPTTGSSRD